MILAIGLLLTLLAFAVILDAAGLATWVIRNLTSRSLGGLAPGYAGTRSGLRVYAALILSIAVAVCGLGLSLFQPLTGVMAIVVAALGFLIGSVVALVGEVRTFRSQPGPRPRQRS